MRIALAVGRFEPIGGSERYALDLAEQLCLAGDQLVILSAGGDAPLPPGAERMEFAPLGNFFAASKDYPDGAAALADLSVDVILLVSGVAPWVARLLAQRAPLVRFVQDHTFFCPGLNKRRKDGSICTSPAPMACVPRALDGGCLDLPRGWAGARRILGRVRELGQMGSARHILVASEYMREELEAAGARPREITVCPYFTQEEPDPGASLPPDLAEFFKAQAPRPVFLCAARLVPEKGVEFLLEAMARVPDCALILAGEGPLLDSLKADAQGHGISDRILFTGWIAPPAMRAILTHVRASIMPSLWAEPFGIVGIEAMAHARAMIACDVGGVRQWLEDETTGILVPPHDIPALVQAIDRLTEDPALATRLGQAGQAKVAAEFRAQRHVETLRGVLDRVAGLNLAPHQ